MSDGASTPQDPKHDGECPARQPWVRPAVVKMEAGDAELGTRATGPDGAFSVS